jgi:aminoglycoside phosphotransferase (APT) family kinase protein
MPSSQSAGEVDIEQPDALRQYLIDQGHVQPEAKLAMQTLAGGVSNKTVQVTIDDERAWVIKQALPKLRVEADWYSDPARIHREAEGMRLLGELVPGQVPALIFEDESRYILAMAAVPSPHANFKDVLLAGDAAQEQVEAFGQLLGTIHKRAWEQRDRLIDRIGDQAFFYSLRLEPFYEYTASQCPAAGDHLNALVANYPQRVITLTHGDYSPKNILLHDGQLMLLDHEVMHFGDPAFDLGFSLTHLLSKAHHLSEQRNQLHHFAKRYWLAYQQAVGDVPWHGDVESQAVLHTLGCLLARVDGRSPLGYLTDDERQAQRDAAVALMQDPPKRLEDLMDRFIQKLSRR